MMSDIEKQLILILSENERLKEELNMRKLKENEAKIDTQETPSQPVSKTDGEPLNSDGASQDDMAKKYAENEAKMDTQVEPPQPVKTSDGATPVPEGASQDKMADKYPVEASRMENTETPEDKEVGKAENERFKEIEGDMDKVADILEALRNQISALEKRIEALEASKVEIKPAEKADEPVPPMTESMQLRNTFVEMIKPDTNEFGKTVREVIYK